MKFPHRLIINGFSLGVVMFFHGFASYSQSQFSIESTKTRAEIKKIIYDDTLSNPWSVHLTPFLKEIGGIGAGVVVEILSETDQEFQKVNLLKMLGSYEDDAAEYLPFVLDLIKNQEGKTISEEQFKTMLFSFETAASITNKPENLIPYFANTVQKDYWNKYKAPQVIKKKNGDGSIEYVDSGIVVIRLRKHTINALAIIADERCIQLLAEQEMKERQGGDPQLSYVFSWTLEFIGNHGSIKNYHKVANVVVD